MSRIVVSHPTGNANVRAVLSALDGAGLLHTFYTTVGLRRGSLLERSLPASLRRKAARRAYDLEQGKIVFRPWREMARLAGCGGIDSVYIDLDRFVARQVRELAQGCSGDVSRRGENPRAVYCYEDGALATFQAARELGLKRFYDLPIAYWETAQRLLREEADRLPTWEPTLVGTRDPDEKLQRKKSELELADVVLCPSQFVEESIPASIRATKVCVRAEFGSPAIELPERRERGTSGPLRVLFAGSMTQRKGLADLFAAMKLLKRGDVRLVVMGSPVAPLEFYRREYDGFDYEPPRPHQEVLALMQACDVLVLPSIVEGRALVQQEAMACGLPLIATANAGGSDLIQEGRTGFLVPIRSPEGIAEKLAWLADHRAVLPAMGDAARRKARTYTWEGYGARVRSALQEALRPDAAAEPKPAAIFARGGIRPDAQRVVA